MADFTVENFKTISQIHLGLFRMSLYWINSDVDALGLKN